MNYLQLCKRVVLEADRDDTLLTTVDLDEITDEMHRKVVTWVEQAYEAIQRDQAYWGFLFKTGDLVTLRANVQDYNVSNVREAVDEAWTIRKASETVRYPLQWIEYRDWLEIFRLVNSTLQPSMPLQVTRLPSGAFRFTPTPDQAYVVSADRFTLNDTMAQDLDEPSWESDFHEIIVWRALAYYAEEYDVPALAARVAMNLPSIDRKFKNRYLPDATR